ncbi:MAG TPA: AI-2E family transporter [Pyrinomonadaceae bacterium]
MQTETQAGQRPERAAQATAQAAAAAAEAASSEAQAASSQAQATTSQTRSILRLLLLINLSVLGVVALIWALYKLTSVLLLLVLSVFFAYLIAPLVELTHRPYTLRGRRRMMPRALAIGVVYLGLFGTLFGVVALLLPVVSDQLTQLAQAAPAYLRSVQARAQSWQMFYERARLPPNVRDYISTTVARAFEGVSANASATLFRAAGLLAYVPWLVLIPILAFFLLKDADTFRRSALQMLPRGRLRWRGDELFQDVNSTLAAYIRAQLIACLLIGTLCTVGFLVIGVPYAVVLGIVAGLLEFIPLVGPLTVAVLAVLLASFHSGQQALVVFLFLVVLRIVHDYVTYPRIIGQGIHLHPLAVILAILCGAELAGIAGIFLAIPVIAIISVTYRHWLEHRGADKGLVATLLEQNAAAAAETQPAHAQQHTRKD